MSHFDLDGVTQSALKKVLDASFPECNYSIQEGRLFFEGGSDSQLKLIGQILKVLRSAESFRHIKYQYPNEYGTIKRQLKYEEDVHIALEARGDVIWIGDGLPLFSGDFLVVKKALERYWLTMILSHYDAMEIENPALWSPRLMQRAQYLSDFPQEATFLFGSKRNSASLGRLQSSIAQDSDGELVGVDASNILESLELIGFCQPSVCTSCFYAMSKQHPIPEGIFTTYNRVFRNEGTSRLDRLLSFSVRDVMAVGGQQFVGDSRDTFLLLADQLIEDLDIEAKVMRATDPFFITNANKLFLQKTADLKHELQAWIPSMDQSIAIGSVNLHLDSFGKRFDMRINESFAHSACMGIGFERLTYALFAQNGSDLRCWTKDIRARLEIN